MDSGSLLCKNCGKTVNNKFCSHCGQSAHVDRINFHYIVHELQHSVLHVDKGIIYTIKELIVRPGYSIKEYLEGKRVNHFKPFSFVVILAAIYGFLIHFSNLYPEAYVFTDDAKAAVDNNKIIFEWMYSHYSLVMFFIIPVSALSSYLVFRKSGYNYMENIIIYSYITGMHIVMLLLFFPFFYITMSTALYFVTFTLAYIYNIWVLSQLFKKTSWIQVALKALFSILLSLLISLILTIGITIIFLILKIYIPQ